MKLLPNTSVPGGERSGFSLVEIVFVMTILLVGMGMFVQTITSTSKLGPVNREAVLAMTAARSVVEQIRSEATAGVLARYNANAGDDPGGPGTAPGSGFAVLGLTPVPGDPDGLAGEIVLPTTGGQLLETFTDPLFGFPRDVNGDGLRDALDHSGDYEVLPLLVRVRWTGQAGPRTLDIYTSIGEL